jgi:diguanylate cyclase (GGDEF)-like protein
VHEGRPTGRPSTFSGYLPKDGTGQNIPIPVATPSLPPISPLRGLLEVTRLVRTVEHLPVLLDAIARVVSESLGYRTVVINLYRPAWNDFLVTTVHGSADAQEALLGGVRRTDEWEQLLSDRFDQRGAYVIPAGSIDWGELPLSYVPTAERTGDWDPEDAMFVPLRHSDGHLVGVLSVDEPLSGRRPTDDELDVLVAFAEHAAIAVQSAQERAETDRHQIALEQLLAVSSRLISESRVDDILAAVCEAIRDALGFQHVLATLLDPQTGQLDVRASIGWTEEDVARAGPVSFREVVGLFDAAFEVEGCFLLPSDEAERRLERENESALYVSELNGDGPWAWNRHWLVVPLHAESGEVIGMLWADEPDDRLLPSAQRLQALRVFANQAAAAILASQYVTELRFLADHDPLTRLLNRRAFVERLDGEVARAVRYRRTFGLVICDLDGFKTLNDQFGHAAGDEALQQFARTLQSALRRGDLAFRIGGDEFALLLAEATETDAREVVERILSQLDGIAASFGVASCPEHAQDPQTLFRLADGALYEAKRTGSRLQFVA